MKKKIAFLIPTLGNGGAERVLVNLVNNMDRSKYDITVRTIFKAGINSKDILPHIRLVEGSLPQFRGNVPIMKLFPPRLLFKCLFKEEYDIIISYLEGPSARIVSGCDNKQTKTIGWIHCIHKNAGEVYYSFRNTAEAERCYYSFDAMAFVSRKAEAEFLTYFPRLNNTHVIHNVINNEEILSLSNESMDDIEMSNDINFISVGNLKEVKGYDRLIDVHARLINEGYKHNIYIIGDGDLRESLINKTHDCGVESTFHFVGRRSNPHKYVKRADAYICSSYSEGFSTSVAEAVILGKPVISTDVSGAKEMLGDNNEYGLVVENTSEGLYEGIKSILSNRKLISVYSCKAEKRREFFSMKKNASAVEDLIISLCNV